MKDTNNDLSTLKVVVNRVSEEDIMLPSKDRKERQGDKDTFNKHVLSIYYPDTSVPLGLHWWSVWT